VGRRWFGRWVGGIRSEGSQVGRYLGHIWAGKPKGQGTPQKTKKTHPRWDRGPHPTGRPQNGKMRVVGLGNFFQIARFL